MTPKERTLLGESDDRLTSGNFDEHDVLTTLILLRNYVGNGPIRELAHHIAHSERRSGDFFNRIRANPKVLNKLGRKPGTIVSQSVFTHEEFAQSLNRALKEFGLEVIKQSAANMVQLCIMSMLQGGSASDGKDALGKISLAATQDSFQLLATTAFKHQDKRLSAAFVILSVPNLWVDICNPRALVQPEGLARVSVLQGQPVIRGFKPFEVYIEQTRPIGSDDLNLALALDDRFRRVGPEAFVFEPPGLAPLPIRWDGQRLILPGRKDFFMPASEYVRFLPKLARHLGACVHDDSKAHWFLDGLQVAPDGFHSHWVGAGSATCNMRL